MAHRGRLSVLAHNLGRSVESILAEFEGSKQIEAVKAVAAIPHGGTGDVKYHYGHQRRLRDHATARRSRVRLYPNPSHLEFVDPVVDRRAPASSSPTSTGRRSSTTRRRAVPVLLHGDAAFPGPGRRRRDAQPAGAEGLRDRRHDPHHPEQPGRLHHRPRGGPLDPLRRRHGEGLQRPDRPRQRRRRRGLLAAVRLAMAYRERWGRDIVIDVIGYRRFGHNETDEPAYTQPLMAAKIKAHPPVSEIYAEKLIEEGVVTREEVERADQRAPRRDVERRSRTCARRWSSGEYEDPTVTDRHRRARPHAPARRSRPRSPSEKLRELNEELLRGPGELHHPPQAAQAALASGSRRWRRAGSNSATPRRSPSPRC